MNTKLIERYYTNENGYHPFFVREHWQVAQLNYLPVYSYTMIERLDLHQFLTGSGASPVFTQLCLMQLGPSEDQAKLASPLSSQVLLPPRPSADATASPAIASPRQRR